jgi:hypothetical protein
MRTRTGRISRRPGAEARAADDRPVAGQDLREILAEDSVAAVGWR